MSIVLCSKAQRIGLAVLRQQQRGLKLKSQGVEYYWRDYPTTRGLQPGVLDRAHYRNNENAKSIAIEGNIAAGKELFGRNFAELCDLKFVEDVTDKEVFTDYNFQPPIDYREYNVLLPKRYQFYTTEMLFTDRDPINEGKPLYVQQSYYMHRYYNWWKSCAHLFNTGQGFVTKRSPFGTYVFAKALAETGRMSKEAAEWFVYYERNLSPTLFRPHLLVYIRAPVEMSRQRLKARAVPWEASIDDKLLEVMNQIYESEFLPRMQRFSEVFVVDADEYDFNDTNDMQYLAEEICKVDLDQRHLSSDLDIKLLQWRKAFFNNDAIQLARDHFSTLVYCVENLMSVMVPEELKEGGLSRVEELEVKAVMFKDPRFDEWWRLNAWDTKSALKIATDLSDKSGLRYTYDAKLMHNFIFDRSQPIVCNTRGSRFGRKNDRYQP